MPPTVIREEPLVLKRGKKPALFNHRNEPVKEGETLSRLSENLTPPHSPQITRNVTTWNLQRTEHFWDDNRTRYQVSSILGLTDDQNPWGLGKGVPIATV